MADTRDLKSLAKYLAYGFESRLRHFLIRLEPCARTGGSRASAPRALAELRSFGQVAPETVELCGVAAAKPTAPHTIGISGELCRI